MPEKELSLRKAHLSDVDFLLKLRKETMDEHLRNADIHLTLEQHKERILNKFEDAKIILYKKQEIGLLKLVKNQMGYEIKQFQIEAKYQGKGFGNQVLSDLIKKANEENISIILSVLKANKARFLYERLGFTITGENEESFFMKKECDVKI